MQQTTTEQENWIAARLEHARKGQWLCPYPDDENLVEVVLFYQDGLWFIMHEFQIYMVMEEHYLPVKFFAEYGILPWDKLLDVVVFPTWVNRKNTYVGMYEGFSVHNPVPFFFVDGESRTVEYIEGPGGIQPGEEEPDIVT